MRINKVTLSGISIDIDDKEIIKELIDNLHLPDNVYISKDGKLCKKVDTSYHGTPHYEERVLYDEDDIKARRYTLLKKLLALY